MGIYEAVLHYYTRIAVASKMQ